MPINKPGPSGDLSPAPRGTQDQGPCEESLQGLEPRLLLACFVDTMMPLSEEDQKRFDAELEKEENKNVREMFTRMKEAIGQSQAGGSASRTGRPPSVSP